MITLLGQFPVKPLSLLWGMVATVGTSNGAIALPPVVRSSAQRMLFLQDGSQQLAQQNPVLPNLAPPDANREPFLQPQPTPQPLAPEEVAPVLPEPEPSPLPPPTADTTQILVQEIRVTGSTIFTEADFDPIVRSVEGQTVTLEALRGVADRITQLYLDGGYITSRAVLVEQVITAGVVQIQVVEGRLEAIDVEGDRRVNASYIRDRIQRGATPPLNQGQLEDQLRLLRLDPLFDNVEASLRAGSGLGQSILTVRVTEATPLRGSLTVDNFSPPSVGSERLGVAATLLSVTGLGDQLYASYLRSTTGGSTLYDFSYRLPVNSLNGTVELRAAPSDYRITNPPPGFPDDLEVEGNADEYEVSFRQPFVRSPREEFALSLGLTYRNGETVIADQLQPNSTTSVLQLGQDYVFREPSGAWAVRSQLNFGTTWFDATTELEPDGQFFSWLGQLQRVQVLSPDSLLIAQVDVQLSPDPLLGSQQFVIGGGQSVRGFRQNARSGDNGVRFSLENRFTLVRDAAGAPTVQLAPFFDLGKVWNVDDNPFRLPEDTFLAGLGLGLLWNPLPAVSIRLDYAFPLVELGDRGTNAQDEGFYFNVVISPP